MIRSPRVTVGIPVFNGESYLRSTIDAILASDFDDLELLIADNGSTDRTVEICRDAASRDCRVIVHRSEVNRGAAWNYNRLVNLARGEYFKWSAADDLIAPTLLSHAVHALDSDAGVVLAYGRTVLIGPTGAKIRHHADGLHLTEPEPWARLRHFAARRWLCNPVFGLLRLEMLRRTSLITTNTSGDITFLAQMALLGRFTEIPEPLFFRRVTADSDGLGGKRPQDRATWLDPSSKIALIPPMLRVFLDIESSIIRSDFTVATRIRTAAEFGHAWCKRQAGIGIWRVRRRLRGGSRSSLTDSVSGTGRQ